jgi:general secretion pathway protein D
MAETRKVISPAIAQAPVIETPDLFVQTVMLKFLKAENIAPIASGLVSSYGTSAIDEDTNSIILCDDEENLKRIIDQIRIADQTPKQILIEVVIIDVQLNDDTEIGVDWDFTGDKGWKSVSGTQLISDAIGTTATGGAFGIIKDGIGVTIRGLQTTRNVEILASPKVLVVSGKEAVVDTTSEIAYTELSQSTGGTADAITSTEFKETGVTLTVKATITDEGRILMDINPSQKINAGADVAFSDVPIVDTRSIQTSLLMDDSQVVVIGGLRSSATTLTQNKIPLLGDIPLIGFLFSSDTTEVVNSELLVLISPHIQQDEDYILPKEQYEKFNELRDKPLLEVPREKPHARNPLGIFNLFE